MVSKEGRDYEKATRSPFNNSCRTFSIVVFAVALVSIIGVVVFRNIGDDDDDDVDNREWINLPCNSERNLKKCPWSTNPLLLVLLDGVRAEYLERDLTPTLAKLQRCGAHTPYLKSMYPSMVGPNQFTIVTGLYPESHGIVSNYMYDPDLNKTYGLSYLEIFNKDWYGGEPVWITTKKQGKKSAAYFWLGSDIEIQGMQPDIWKRNNAVVTFEERVDIVLDVLKLPTNERPDQISMYFMAPDLLDPETNGEDEILDKIENTMARLMDGLLRQKMDHCVNLIVVTDSGMDPQDCSQAVFTSNYTDDLSDRLMFDGPTGNVFPEYKDIPDTGTAILDNAKDTDDIVADLSCRHPTMNVFSKATMPRRHHYGNSQRIGDVILTLKEGWNVFKDSLGFCYGGDHGWNATNTKMNGVFFAHGPAFKENITPEPFDNIELYNIMCDLLDITPASNNGTAGSLHHILVAPKSIDTPQGVPNGDCNLFPETFDSCGCSTSDPIPTDGIILRTDDNVLRLGEPVLTVVDDVCVLHQHEFSTGYSRTLDGPVWLSTILIKQESATEWNSKSECVIIDTRFPNSSCDPTINVNGVTMTPLISETFRVNGKEASLTSTRIPMYDGFRDGVWQTVLELIDDYLAKYGRLSVTMGPLYDYNNDGLWEGKTDLTRFADNAETIPLPTHIYIMVAKCRDPDAGLPCGDDGDIDVLSFILPHVEKDQNCQSPEMYLKDNLVRVRDIEFMAGFQFITQLNDVARAVRLRTSLPLSIWPTDLFPEWIELPCPEEDLCTAGYKPLLLVSLDGFSADYLLRKVTPTIARLEQCGAHAPFMRSVYPTNTFPNHYSIITELQKITRFKSHSQSLEMRVGIHRDFMGLYPESHGIVDNNMYDVDLEERFSLGSDSSFNPEWWKGEPLWITAQNQGLKAATFFWPGADVNISGTYPYIYKKFDRDVTFESRVQEVISWMLRPADQRPDMITLYFEEPDFAGHIYGPSDIEKLGATLEMMDHYINDLLTGLYRYDLHNCVNLVIVADHGMEETSCDRQVRLKDLDNVDYQDLTTNYWVWDGAFGRISNTYVFDEDEPSQLAPADSPKPIDKLVDDLTCVSPNMAVYTKETIPVRFHYSNNERIDNILLKMEPGWLFARNSYRYCDGGNHGYDNRVRSMESLFLAYGPAFVRNYTAAPFESIELYNLFTDVLGINASPNNGTVGALYHMLLNAPPHTQAVPSESYTDALAEYRRIGDFLDLETKNCGGSCSSPKELLQFYRALRRPRNSTEYHLPYEPPIMTSDIYVDRNVVVLYEEDRVTAYDIEFENVVWASKSFGQNSDFFMTGATEVSEFTELMTGPLLSQTDFGQNLVNFLTNLIFLQAISNGEANVMIGYAYDDNHDSLPDVVESDSIPSHLVISISTPCQVCDNINAYNYIIPRQAEEITCQTAFKYMDDHAARVRDIEIVTGFEYYTEMSAELALFLRTRLSQK